MNEGVWDRILRALSDRRRRQILVALGERSPPAEVDIDAFEPLNRVDQDTDRVRTELVHNHLPLLEDLDYIRWNEATWTVTKGPAWDELEPVLNLVQENRADLPDGWT